MAPVAAARALNKTRHTRTARLKSGYLLIAGATGVDVSGAIGSRALRSRQYSRLPPAISE